MKSKIIVRRSDPIFCPVVAPLLFSRTLPLVDFARFVVSPEIFRKIRNLFYCATLNRDHLDEGDF